MAKEDHPSFGGSGTGSPTAAVAVVPFNVIPLHTQPRQCATCDAVTEHCVYTQYTGINARIPLSWWCTACRLITADFSREAKAARTAQNRAIARRVLRHEQSDDEVL